MTKAVIAIFSVIGFHSWPDAPPEVKYLSSEHRHEFKFRVEVRVDGSDREVEFHILKRLALTKMASLFSRNHVGEFVFGSCSCEMIAEQLGVSLRSGSHLPVTAIEVWEDGENGSRLEWSAP